MTIRFFSNMFKLCERAYALTPGNVDPDEPVVDYWIRAINGCGNGRYALDVYVKWPDGLEATESEDVHEKSLGKISLFSVWMPEAVLVLDEVPLCN